MFKLFNIADTSVNVLDLFPNFKLKKWKSLQMDSSYNLIDPSIFVNQYISNDIYTEGIIMNSSEGIDPFHYSIDASGLIVFNYDDVPNYFIWKGLDELESENTALKTRVNNLENLVSQLIAIVDPSISI